MNAIREAVSNKNGTSARLPETHLFFFDTVRTATMLSVVLYHAVAAYSTLTPHWSVHDGVSAVADGIRELFDVYMMPVFFFVAGYFAVPSLRKQGSWRFIEGKIRRIGVPWLLAVLVIVPIVRYAGELKTGPSAVHQAFWKSWIGYLKGAGTFRVGLWTVTRVNQMHFWFLSLLLTFFIVYGFVYALKGFGGGRRSASQDVITPSRQSVFAVLSLAVGLATIGYFIVSMMTPDLSWVTVDLLWQFQPGGLVLYVIAFLLGGFAFSRRWFEGVLFFGRPALWALLVVPLASAFFLIGSDLFSRPSTSHLLSPALLLAFSLARSMLCFAVLFLLIALGRTYGKKPSRLNQGLSANSYNIYLVHIFFVTFLQDVLMIWRGGPPMAKAWVIFVAVVPISYVISRTIDRSPRVWAAAFVLIFAVVVLWAR
jgi:glucan biosynthesis protein C